jgi:hypothetical protein
MAKLCTRERWSRRMARILIIVVMYWRVVIWIWVWNRFIGRLQVLIVELN